MTRWFGTLLALISTAWLLVGCEDECSPTDFGGGQQCGDEPGLYQSCRFNECLEGPFCVERWVIDDQYCASTAHNCVQLGPGETTCVGEIIGTCSTQGFVRCEDAFTMIYCGDDGFGALVLQRGVCAAGARCYDLHESSFEHPEGCQPAF